MMQGWAEDLAENPFALLLNADNACNHGCCKIQLVKRGDDYRICSCEHKRPVFAMDEENKETHHESLCVCCRELA